MNSKNKRVIVYSIIVLMVIIAIVLSTFFATNVNNTTSQLTAEDVRAMTYEEVTDEDSKIENCDYIQFSSFFTRDLNADGYAERIKGTCKEISQTDTLYIELNVLTQGYLKNGKITLNAENFIWSTAIVNDDIVDGNYIGETKSIKLQDEIVSGSEKLFSGIINSKINDNINNYSKVNSVTLTGVYVDEEGNETSINKTVNLTVDWYGITETKVNKYSSYKNQSYDIAEVVTNNGVILKYKISVSETAEKLLLQKQIAEISIPKLNGYSPIDVKIDNKIAEYSYNQETGILTITRTAKTDDSGNIEEAISKDNTDYIEVTYPIEAYTKMNEDSIVLSVKVVGYNYGYNNINTEFQNPYISSAEDVITVTYSKPEGDIWNIYPYVGERIYNSNLGSYEYKISKEIATNLYNGNIYEEAITTYPVNWNVIVGDYTAINTITLEEQKENDNSISDKFLNTANKYDSMYDYINTKGIYFKNATSILGSDGWIELYNAQTGTLLEKFTIDTWENYTEQNPYKIETKSIKIVTSAPIANTSFTVTQIKELNDRLIINNYSKEEFDKLSYIYTYLNGKIQAPDGITYENGTKEAQINKAESADYTMPYSVSKITIEPNKISNQETQNVNFTISTTSENNYEDNWKDGVFLLELPKNIIGVKINSVTSSDKIVKISGYEAYEKDDIHFIKVYTSNAKESIYEIKINADIAADPLKPTESEYVTLYSYNKNCDNYYYRVKDIYDLDTDHITDDYVGYSRYIMSLIAPSNLLTAQYITNYDDFQSVTIAPNIADIEKSNNSRTATININVINNYNGTISDTIILGKIPFEGNTYVINGGSLNSQFTANMKLQIQVPEKLQEDITVYYSENTNPTKDINEQSNGWKKAEEIKNWSLIRTYLIDFGTYKLQNGENQVFSYDVEVPGGMPYNYVSYSNHAIFYNIDTENGKLAIETEPNKVGIQIVEKYNMQLTKNKKGFDAMYVKGATYKVTTTDADGNEIVKMGTTNANGMLQLDGLYIEREYTLEEVASPEDYVLSEDKVKFKASINEQGEFIFNLIEGNFKETPSIITNESGRYFVKANVEDEAKYTLKINKTDTENIELDNIKFVLNGKGQEEKIYRTDENGSIVITGLYPNEVYELKETRADGYYIENASKLFKIIINENEKLEMQTEDSILKTAIIQEQEGIAQSIVTLNIQNEKIPTYNLQIIKVEEDVKEDNIDNLKKLSGASFRLISEDTEVQQEFTTNENGIIEITDLYKFVDGKYITGNYTLQEIRAPEGYSNNAEEIKFKVINNAEGNLEIQIENKENLTTIKQVIVEENTIKLVIQDKALFKLLKTDSETGEKLANAKFVIFEIDDEGQIVDYAKDINNNYVGEKNDASEYVVTTDENGNISLPLRGGIYKIIEVKAPEGYEEDSAGEYFKVQDTKINTTEEDTEEEPEVTEIVEINYVEDLVELSNIVNDNTISESYEGKKVILMRNLDFREASSYYESTGTSYGDLNGDGTIEGIMAELTDEDDGCGFTPIGMASKGFKGVFDGQGYEIKNLYINAGISNARII